MRYLFTILLVLACNTFARTPLDTLAWERSDSGAKYVKIHGAYPREQTLYTRFIPDSIPAGTTVELIDSLRGRGTVMLPALSMPGRYLLQVSAFTNTNASWVYTLKLDTTTLFTGTYTSSKVQVRDLVVYADTLRKRLYVARTTRNEASAITVVDSVGFTNFGLSHRVHWTLNVTAPARLLAVRGYIQQ